MQLQPDTLLQGRYRVGSMIAQGGMGAVYRAVDERLGNTVALKQTLMSDPALRVAFEREARLLAGLQHPSLPVVSDHFSEGGGQFLVMQFIPGDDLAALLRARGAPFPADQVLAWADALLDALAYLHGRQPPVIHRDIKPQNLKLAPHGGVVLLDFGLAKGVTGSGTTPSPSLYGYTPQYAPIEQIQGSGTDARSDLYSLAATLAELLTGSIPPDALTRAAAAVRGEPDPLGPLLEQHPAIPPHVAAALGRALALNPAMRPQSAVAMRAELGSGAPARAARPAAGGHDHAPPTIQLPREAAPPPAMGSTIAVTAPAQGRGRLPLLVGLMAVVGVLLVTALVALAGERRGGAALGATAVPTAPGAPTAGPPAPGASFANPVAYGQDGGYGPLTIRVLDTQRGREAWNAMRKANQFNDPPPEGYEYYLVQLALTAAADAPQLYPRLAGERGVLYTPGGVSPAPLPDAFAAGQRVEAWLPYMVATDEADLVLHIDALGELASEPLYLAADEGARYRLDPGLEAIEPDEVGVEHGNPAPVGATAVSEDYAVTVLAARRGPAVLAELVANYANVERPRRGYEYALVQLRVRYLGDGGVLGWAGVGPSDIDTLSRDAADPAAEAIDHPDVYVLPDALPALDFDLLPGGEATGWTVVELPVGEAAMVLVFSPGFDASGLNTRYFALD